MKTRKERVASIANMKEKVEFILKDSIDARNDDKVLIWSFWSRYCYIGEVISKEQFFALPSPIEIKRLRAVIQNTERKYIPTIESVAVARDWKVDDWRLALQYESRAAVESRKAPAKGQTTIFDFIK